MTTYRVPTVERAYQLARSGEYTNVAELKAKLKAESYGDADAQLAGPFIRRQLTKLCNEAVSAKQPATPADAPGSDARAT